ncbi:cellulose synthase subunit BcsC [Phaeobacter sp. CECT 5382]|uniref:tetratricopeptide repeat-containing sulfotransferase family protein n=1 Tax=Phaeobacter sp. CECT 5382 TaxID=1712645 RepID=UPI0006DA2564|nr:tetratricopeptide repeat-containing sulfotransferase family protein [Phaeobacter sp. CECT 5382]CUH86229.1 cellulose synthase subunit BcsC [Phaeobacter sp. CECT 5382]
MPNRPVKARTGSINLDAISAELNQGRFKSVLKQVKPLLKDKAAPASVANLAAIALCGLERPRDALPMFKKALTQDPTFHDARKNLAQTLILMGQPDKALPQLDYVLAALPDHPEVLYLKAQALWSTGRLAEAETCLTSAIDLAPDQGRNYNLRALIRSAQGQEMEALTDFEAALQANPNDVEALVNISQPLARQTRHQDSQAVITQALALAPQHLGANLRQAALHIEQGDAEAARQRYRQILAHTPGQPEALEHLALLSKGEEAQALLAPLHSALKVFSRASEDRARLNFGLAHLARLRQDLQKFASHLSRANADMAGQFAYDSVADRHQTKAILQQFPLPSISSSSSSDTSQRAPTATSAHQLSNSERRAIFITGLPRSGTTLAEAVLGAHPHVAPLGERAAAGALLRPYLDAAHPFDGAAQQDFGEAYSLRLPDLPPEIQAYSDKMPENYRYIGYLIKAFPNCRILCMRRDARDIALSMWQAHFSGQALAYSYDLAAMAERFNLHAEMVAHWQRLFPEQILSVRYEDLTGDIEGESRRIAAFTGLNWYPEMMNPGAADQPILTLSATQVRQKVHQRSVGGWAKYAEMLRPFLEGLDPALWPEMRAS